MISKCSQHILSVPAKQKHKKVNHVFLRWDDNHSKNKCRERI
jgi:hypothetical protein